MQQIRAGWAYTGWIPLRNQGFDILKAQEIENDWAYESNCSVYALPSIQTFVGPWFKAMAGMPKPQKMERG